MGEPSPTEVRSRLLAWYAAKRRDLPWRRTRDPYRILVAEYLLQRTRIASGTPYYERFLMRFPTVQDLAAASLDDVLAVWEGLGFYGRARRLHAAARVIVAEHAGKVPPSYEVLAALPGIGPYTAGAIASIAFGIVAPAVDGNVVRVLARLFRIREDVTSVVVRRRIVELAATLVSRDAPGAFNQAIMELGATVCTPTRPACDRCPLENQCLARAAGEEREIPITANRKKPRAVPVAFALIEAKGRVLLVRREPGTLLGGLWGLPGGEVPSRATVVPRRSNVLASEVVRLDLSVLSDAGPVPRRKGPLDPTRGGPPAPPCPVPSGGPRVSFRSRELRSPLKYSFRNINKASLDEPLWDRDRSALGAALPRGGTSGVHGPEFSPGRPRRRRGSNGHLVDRRQCGSSPGPRHTPG